MSVDTNLAVSLLSPLGLFGFIGGSALLILAFTLLIKKMRARRRAAEVWMSAADELGILLLEDGSDLGPIARGKVNSNVVTIAPISTGATRGVSTLYTVKFEAPEAPKFRLVRRTEGTSTPTLDTGNRSFDGKVSVETDSPVLFARFLTASRRSVILRLLNKWPGAEITNREAMLLTSGVEAEQESLVDAVCYLVAAAEIFDRPTRPQSGTVVAPAVSAPTEQHTSTDEVVNGDTSVLTMARLDEQSIIRELFDSDLSVDETATQFARHYEGREVTWTGEVVRVGTLDETGTQRIAALIGSANGLDPQSGRVVAVTTVGAEPKLAEGDIARFSGLLANLDVEQRLLHLHS